MTRHVGFTGARGGMSEVQEEILDDRLAELIDSAGSAVLHSGACIGSDEKAHQLAWTRGYRAVLHPPRSRKLRAWVERSEFWGPDDVVLPEKDYLERDVDIASCSEILFATPDGPPRTLSGTYYTIRAAQRLGVPTVVIMPDGEILG